jgi:predicted hydrocarbon binding protein
LHEEEQNMKQSQAVSSLFKDQVLLPPDNISNSILGYLFFRGKLTEIILGDSEVNILYWAGKELGTQFNIVEIEEIEEVFMQLDLGQVYLDHQSHSFTTFRITHNRFNLLDKDRLTKTLHLEAGLLAGMMEKITAHYCAAHVSVKEQKDVTSAYIEIAIDREK